MQWRTLLSSIAVDRLGKSIKDRFHNSVDALLTDTTTLKKTRDDLGLPCVPESAKQRYHLVEVVAYEDGFGLGLARENNIVCVVPLILEALSPVNVYCKGFLLLCGDPVILRVGMHLAPRRPGVKVAVRGSGKDLEAPRAVELWLAMLSIHVLLNVFDPSQLIAQAILVLIGILSVEGTC